MRPQKYWIISLFLAIAFVATGCQKAKLKAIPRKTADPGPAVTDNGNDDDSIRETSPPPTTQRPPVPTTPPNSSGEGDIPPPDVDGFEPPAVTGPSDGLNPPLLVPTSPILVEPIRVTPDEPPLVRQDGIPQDKVVIEWLSGGQPPAVLNKCAWIDCRPTPPRQPRPWKSSKVIYQPSELKTHKVDVIFVVDTSASVDDERAAIVNNITRFTDEVSKLSQNSSQFQAPVDINMGVILAHGPRTDKKSAFGKSAHGNLFVHPGEGSSTAEMLSSSLSTSQLKTALHYRFNGGAHFSSANISSVRQSGGAQGEAGLLSLQKFIETSKDNYIRDDAALMVVFISDENDVCYNYAEENALYSLNGDTYRTEVDAETRESRIRTDIPQIDFINNFAHYGYSSEQQVLDATNPVRVGGQGTGLLRDINEHESFLNPQVCNRGERGGWQDLRNLLNDSKETTTADGDDLPVIITGVLYRDDMEQKEAQNKKLNYWGDNEAGHGYLNLIHAMNGSAHSLLSPNFSQELFEMGRFTRFQIAFNDEVEIIDKETDQLVLFEDIDQNHLNVVVYPIEGGSVTLTRGQDYELASGALQQDSNMYGYIKLYENAANKVNLRGAGIQVLY